MFRPSPFPLSRCPHCPACDPSPFHRCNAAAASGLPSLSQHDSAESLDDAALYHTDPAVQRAVFTVDGDATILTANDAAIDLLNGQVWQGLCRLVVEEWSPAPCDGEARLTCCLSAAPCDGKRD